MKVLEQLEQALSKRTKREKILFGVALVLGLYVCFHSYFLSSWQRILTLQEEMNKNTLYLSKKQNFDVAKNLQEAKQMYHRLDTLTQLLNSYFLTYPQALQTINFYARQNEVSLLGVDFNSDGQNYMISLEGSAPFENLLVFLDCIERLPLIHISSLILSKDEPFFLSLKTHKIFPLSKSDTKLEPQGVFSRLQKVLQWQDLDFSFLHNGPQKQEMVQIQEPKWELQAILNQRAKIDGKWIQKGEQIGAFVLVKIEKDAVILQSQNQNKRLAFKKREVF